MTFSQFSANYRRRLVRAGHKPIRAVEDAAGNCRICGEAGRCPGWHYPGEPGTVSLPLDTPLFDSNSVKGA